MVEGKHRMRTVISTDTFVKQGGAWKEVASHRPPKAASNQRYKSLCDNPRFSSGHGFIRAAGLK